MKRRSVAKGIPFLLLGIAAIAAVAVYIILSPEILKDIVWLLILAIVAIAAVVLVIFAAMFILAIPFYIFKGEQYQDGVSYDLKDVKPVRETQDIKDRKE